MKPQLTHENLDRVKKNWHLSLGEFQAKIVLIVNKRRIIDVNNNLICVRIENPEKFQL